MNHKMKLIFGAVGLIATMSVFVFPSTNMVAYSQGGNQTSPGVKEQAQEKAYPID